MVKVASDSATKANKVKLSGGNPGDGDCAEGQLLLLYNGDEEPLTGDAEVGAGRAVLFLYSHQEAGPGGGWVPLTTVDARSTKLLGISELKAAANLDIGDFTLKAQQLVAAGQSAGQVVSLPPSQRPKCFFPLLF